jgi:cellulose synthase operon protein C
MRKSSIVLNSIGLLATWGASLEESSAAPKTTMFQSELESQLALGSEKNPSQEMNGWSNINPTINQRSKTLNVQPSGVSGLDAITRQARQFSKSLRRNNDLSEGFFNAPGQLEFADYMNMTDPNDLSQKGESAEKLRSATIASIGKILTQPGRQHQRVELLLRLSELYAERYSYYLQKELALYEAAHDQWQKNQRRGKEPVFNQKKSIAAMSTATQILRKLVNQYPNHGRTPEALYQLGFLLTELKSDSAALYFKRLIERFPKSQFVQDANLAMGEFHFGRNQFTQALGYYQKALSDRKHRSYPYAAYKLGWTFFNIRDNEQITQKNLNKALLAFKLLVKFTDESGSGRKHKVLRKDALRDMVLVYADIGDIAGAKQYFRSVEEPELYITLLERLAWLHAEAGRNAEAAELYGQLVKDFPNNKKNPDFLLRLAALYEKEQKRPLLVEHLERAHLMTLPNSTWYKSQSDKQTTLQASNNVTRELSHWCQRLHAEFQKSLDKKTASTSLAIYDLALKRTPDSIEQFTLLFNRSQLLTALNEHKEAISGYLAATELDKKLGLKKPETKIGLENAIAEGEILIQQSSSQKQHDIRKFHESRLLTTIDIYTELFPNDKNNMSYMHRAAWLNFNKNNISEAQDRWLKMAKLNPRDPLVGEGLRLLVKRSFDNKNWLKAGQDTKHFLGLPGIRSAAVAIPLLKLHKVAYFQHALTLEKQRKHTDAARLFTDFQKSFSDDPDAPRAMINAANNFFKASQTDEALSTLKLFVRTYPQSSLKTRALELTVGIAQSQGQFADAALSLEMLSQQVKTPEQGAQNLKLAAEYRLAEGNFDKSIRNASAAITRLRHPEEVCSAYKIVLDGQLALKRGESFSTAKEAASRCAAHSPQWSIYFSGVSAQLALANGQRDDAAKIAFTALNLGTIVKNKLENPFAFEGLHLAGSVQLKILEAKSKELMSKRIHDSNSIQVEFGKIKNTAQTLAQQYSQLARFAQPETSVAALYRVGEIQETLAQILVQAPNPRGVSEQEAENFRSRIEKIAIPLQEEASSLYAQALEKAHDAEVITPYTELLQDRLASTRPDDFRRKVEYMPAPAYMTHAFPITEQTKGVFNDD